MFTLRVDDPVGDSAVVNTQREMVMVLDIHCCHSFCSELDEVT